MYRKSMLFTLLLSAACAAYAQLTVRTVQDGLFIPWELVYGPDGHIWFTQKNGYICRLDPVTSRTDTLYHETATVIRAEGGMTGLALHPSFPAQPYVFAAHNYLQGTSYRIRIMRYTYNGSTALGSPAVIFDHINGSNYHNGTRLVIDGDKLFVTTGDAEDPAIAQNTGSVNGKVLRINLDGTIPADNPFPGSPVWSKGHRNPQGLVMANGILYSSEHGANSDDEVNIIRKGRNYGWPSVQGFCNTPSEATFCTDSNVAVPLIAWTPTLAVSGIDYYNHPMFPLWANSLLMNTLKDQHLYLLRLNAARDSVTSATVIPGVNAGRLRDICISPSGRVYLSTSNSNAAGTGAFTDKIIELYDAASTGIGSHARGHISVYPNPAAGQLCVSLADYTNGVYTITDMQGRRQQQGVIAGKSLSADIAACVPGVYFIVIKGDDGVVTSASFVKK